MNYIVANSPKKYKGKFISFQAMKLCGEVEL